MNELQNKKLLLIDITGSEALLKDESSVLAVEKWQLFLNKDSSQLSAYLENSWNAVLWRLENSTNIKQSLKEALRLTEPGGVAIISCKLNAQKKISTFNLAKTLLDDVEIKDCSNGISMIIFNKPIATGSEIPENDKENITNENRSALKVNKAILKRESYITADISPNVTRGFFGSIDLASESGVHGWLVNAENLIDPISVSIILENELIGTAYTVIFRADVAKIIERPVNAGLHFRWQQAKLPAWIKERDAEEDANLSFVINGSDLHLQLHQAMPTIREIRTWVGSGEAQLLSGSQKRARIQNYEGQHVEPTASDEVKAIAFYLPQYHPVPENDEWWGAGFTEWTNVSQAKPLFPGHYQPHVPADLGYYDLRLPEVREAQAELAKRHGIHGFCYYYYWFAGRRILERPLQEVLETGKPDFPFCICWANENWSRRWDGSEHDVLLNQVHSEENDIKFIHDVIPILKDPRYIRVNGKPILIVYRLPLLPDPLKTANLWRKICRDEGLGEIYLCAVESFGYSNPNKDGFDAAVQFPPHDVRVLASSNNEIDGLSEDYTGVLYDYDEVVFNELNREIPNYKRFRGVMCSWDNTARKKKAGNVFLNATPESYELWLRGVVDYTRNSLPAGERLVFINAWNEWAEGTHLEPDLKFGHGFLEATQRALGANTDWRVLLKLAESKQTFSSEEVREWSETLRNHFNAYEQSLRYLTKINKPKQRDMANRAVFVNKDLLAMDGNMLEALGEGNIEQIGTTNATYGINRELLNRTSPVYMSGWAVAKNCNVNDHSPSCLTLIRISDRKQYFAFATMRYKRDDILKLKSEYIESEATYSGFRGYLDLTNVEQGEYQLGMVYLDSALNQFGALINAVAYFKGSLIIV